MSFDKVKVKRLVRRMEQFKLDIDAQIGIQHAGDPNVYIEQYNLFRREVTALTGIKDLPIAQASSSIGYQFPWLAVMSIKALIGQLLVWFKDEAGYEDSSGGDVV